MSDLNGAEKEWRPGPESNRCTRLCRPLRNHSATWPGNRRRHGGTRRCIGRCPGRVKTARSYICCQAGEVRL